MTNRLQMGSNRLAERMLLCAAVTITYKRGVIEILNVRAVVGQTTFAFMDMNGADQRIATKDFVIQRGDLNIINPPMRGDRLILVEGLIRFTCEVLPPNDEAEYKTLDGFNSVYRIHTKVVKEEVIPE